MTPDPDHDAREWALVDKWLRRRRVTVLEMQAAPRWQPPTPESQPEEPARRGRPVGASYLARPGA